MHRTAADSEVQENSKERGLLGVPFYKLILGELVMPVIDLFKKFRDNYMKSSVDKMNFPEFPPDEERRYRIIFSGTVQGVGFRYEAWLVAQKLKLSGFAKNRPDGTVLVEVQGQKNKLKHFILCMENIRRIYVENKMIEEIPLKEEEGFEPIY